MSESPGLSLFRPLAAEPPESPVPVSRARLVVVETVVHAGHGIEPASYDSRYSRWLDSDEQPYQRRLKVGPEWRQLDTGWVKEPGLLLLANQAPAWTVQPTAEEKQQAADRVLEVAWGREETIQTPPLFLVRPGESLRVEPAGSAANLFVRCPAGPVQAVLVALPR